MLYELIVDKGNDVQCLRYGAYLQLQSKDALVCIWDREQPRTYTCSIWHSCLILFSP